MTDSTQSPLPSVFYLDERGAPEIKALLHDKIYQYYSWVPAKGQEPVPVTLDDLEHFTVFELFEALAKQSKFPLPKPGQYSQTLPKDLDKKTYGPDFHTIINTLFYHENRDAGPHGQRIRGNTKINTVNASVFEIMIDWMANALPAKIAKLPAGKQHIKMPKLPVARTINDKFIDPEERYKESNDTLKAAFLKGLGAAAGASSDESFIALFKRFAIASGEFSGAVTTTGIVRGQPVNFIRRGGLSLPAHIIHTFNPGLMEALRDHVYNTAISGASVGTLTQKFMAHIRSALTGGNYQQLLSEEEAFQLGWNMRDQGVADIMVQNGTLGFTLGERVELTPDMLDKLTREQQQNQQSPNEWPRVINVGLTTFSIQPSAPLHPLIADHGVRYDITIKRDEEEDRTLSITLPKSVDLAAFFRKVCHEIHSTKHYVEGAADAHVRHAEGVIQKQAQSIGR